MDVNSYLDALRHELEQYKDRPGFVDQAEAVEAEISRVEADLKPTVEPPATPAKTDAS